MRPRLKSVSPEPLAYSLDELGLSTRVRGALVKDRLVDAGELVKLTESDLRRTSGIGVRAIAEIKTALAKLGLRLRDEPEGSQ
jgi:DNA-directed RNA polymerase alpha subunit